MTGIWTTSDLRIERIEEGDNRDNQKKTTSDLRMERIEEEDSVLSVPFSNPV
jgi:hypothetical protein